MLYKFGMILSRIFSYLLLRVKAYNQFNEPKKGALIVCANHVSIFDPFLIGMNLSRNIRFMAKAELFKFKPFGFVAKKFGAFPINREGNDITAIKTSLKILKDNQVLGIFPEGTRASNEEKASTKSGIGMLIYKTKATVLPTRIIVDKYKLFFFRKVTIIYGEPIKYEDVDFGEGTPEDLKRISQDIMDYIYSLAVK